MKNGFTLPLVGLIVLSSLAQGEPFVLGSPTVSDGGVLGDEQVYNDYGCRGMNRSPALEWTGVPAGTASFAVTLFDPDAPTGGGWWHWIVYNIPATTKQMPANAGDARGELLPPGAVQGRTDFGTHAYGGACPPRGSKPHRYIFTVYALGVERLGFPPDSDAGMIRTMIEANAIDKASITATYSR